MFGLKRLRALELIRQALQTLAKYVELNSNQYISNILRRQLINAMLFVISEYNFSSIACQQALQVLDFLKKAFQHEEIEILKKFVQDNLDDEKAHLRFAESGRLTTNTNLASIIKMGIELKSMTLDTEATKNLNDDSEDEVQTDMSPHQNDSDWVYFCNEGNLKMYEKKWTTRLEDYKREDEKEASKSVEQEEEPEQDLQAKAE